MDKNFLSAELRASPTELGIHKNLAKQKKNSLQQTWYLSSST
jgi:hypothetical protein